MMEKVWDGEGLAVRRTEKEGRGKVGFVMNGQDAKKLSDFCAFESIYFFNDTIHFHAESDVNRFKS